MSFLKSILDDFFSSITSFGSPIFYILVILVSMKFGVPFYAELFFALIFVEIICVLIKLIYKKERPIQQARDNIYNKIDANSFPSIHSARISLIAFTFMLFYRDLPTIIIATIVMLCVGYSRIYLKRHHWLDVFAGFFIGIITSLLIWTF